MYSGSPSSWNLRSVRLRSAAESKSVICSSVSTALILKMGVEVFVVDRRGRARFRPQSPRASDDGGVAIACRTGCASVAVSECLVSPAKSLLGRGSGGGREKRRELRRRLAVGESVLLDILGRLQCY